MPDDLSLISTNTLIAELEKRFESTLFVGHKNHDLTHDSATYKYAGNLLNLLGMAQRISNQVQQEMDEVGTKEMRIDA